MPIQGLRDTSNFVAEQRPKNWRETITILYPNGKAPLTALTSLMKSRKVDDPEYNWWEKGMPAQRFVIQAAITSTQTTITLETNAYKQLKDGHLLLIEQTGEIVMVNGDPGSDTINVVRGYSNTTPTAIANIAAAGVNPNAWVIGNAYEEASLHPTGISYDPTKKFNYTQIFRDTLEMSRTAMRTRLRTPDAIKEAKRETLELHSVQMEKAFWLGRRMETTKNGKPIRTTGGVFSFIDSGNIVDLAGAATSLFTLEGHLEKAFRYGSSEKMGFWGNQAALALQRIVRKNTTWMLQGGEKEFGMNVTRLITPFGSIAFKTHPLWNLSTGGTTGGTAYYGMSSWMALLDMSEIGYVYVDDTTFESKLESNGLDGKASGWLTECGVETGQPTAHYLIKGLAAAAADA